MFLKICGGILLSGMLVGCAPYPITVDVGPPFQPVQKVYVHKHVHKHCWTERSIRRMRGRLVAQSVRRCR